MSNLLQKRAEVKRSSNDFSFVDIASNAITNERYMQGYKQFKNGEQTEDSYLWLALSAIGQDAGETIYQNVLNYIDLASNIDLCKVSSLRSMLSAHGIKYQILDKIKNMPIEIENMIDVLSINKKYLLSTNIIDRNLANEIMLNSSIYKDNTISDYVNVEHRTVLDTLSVDGVDLVAVDENLPSPDCMLGKYELFSESGYDWRYADENRQNFDDASIDVYREYINYGSLSVVNADNERVSSYFTIKKFRFLDDDLSACNYGIYLDSIKEKYDLAQNIVFERLSCSMYAYLGNIESLLNYRTGYEAALKTPFDIDYELRDIIARYNATHIFPWNSAAKGIAVNLANANLHRMLYLSAFPASQVKYKNAYIDADKYMAWLVRRFTEQLSSSCSIGYILNGKDSDTPIYETLRNELAEENYNILNSTELSSNARIQKLLNSVELTFNEKKVADDIEEGKDFLFNYDGVKKELIEAEIKTRNSPLSSAYNDCTTRTSFYRESKVRQYFKFIENMNWRNQDITALKANYELNWNMLKQDALKNAKKLISKTPDTGIDMQMVVQVARTLASITLYTAQLREQLKIQAQKNYMKGTFNLLSYVVNEYLCQYPKASQIFSSLSYNSQTRLSVDAATLEKSQFELNGIVYDISNVVAQKEIAGSPEMYAISVLPTNGYLETNIVDYASAISNKISSFAQVEDEFNQIVQQLSAVKANLSTHLYDDVGLIEYDDVTEYFNIKTETSKKSKIYNNLNNKFWDDDTNTNTNTQFAFTDKAINDFYKSILNMSADVDDITDFLNTLYEVGASKSYVGKDEKLHIDADTTLSGEDKDKNISAQIQMFLKFNGQDIAYMPYYNSKNSVHPSYQIHPYLYNFIKTVDFISPIENGFNGVLANQVIADNVMSQLNTNIGANGQIINVWKNNSFDFSGYMSKYEHSAHQSSTDTTKTCPIIDYEGIFYPPAIEDFLKSDTYTKFNISTIEYPAALSNCQMSAYVSSIPSALTSNTAFWNDLTFYHKYYDHLKLSNVDRKKVISQLMQLSAAATTTTVSLKDIYIMSIPSKDAEKPESELCYDIYKYGTDMYGNNYMLLKKYGPSADYEEKQNTPGELFIRLKDYPIAVPAFGNSNQVVSFEDMNGALSNVLYSSYTEMETELNQKKFIKKPYFYDMEFDSSKRSLLLNAWPINSEKFWNIVDPNDEVSKNDRLPTSEYVNQHYYNLRRLDCSQIIICDIDQQVDVITNETKLMLKHDNNGYDSIFQSNGINVIGNVGDKVLSFVGYMNNVKSICPTYVVKTMDVEKPVLDGAQLSVIQEQYTWHADEGIQELTGIADFKQMPSLSKCSYFDSSVKMSYFDNMLTFATIANRPHRNMLTYFGKLAGKTEPEVTLSADFSDDGCSIDLIDQYLVMFDMARVGNSLSAAADAELYNIVVDASYLPLYPNMAGRLDISKSKAFKQQNYQMIQLLGMSSDIDDAISKVNPSADFSYEHEDLTAAISGRIFENYPAGSLTPAQALRTLDDTLHILHNTGSISLQALSTATDVNKEKWSYWSIDLPFDTSASAVNNARKSTLVFANSRTTAKNMYYVGDLSSLIYGDAATDTQTAEEIVLQTKQLPAINYNNHANAHEKDIFADEAEAKVTGTYDVFTQKRNITDNNNIANVSDMKIAVLYGEKTLKLVVYFKREQLDLPSYVDTDVFKFVIYNPHMLKLYEVFHMLDEAGVYYCSDSSSQYFLKKYDPNSKDKDNPTVLSSIPVPRLQNLDFSRYEYLSAIPGLSGYVQNLSFKLDEETIFNNDNPHFYFPGYNDNFPTFIMNIIQSNAVNVDYDAIFKKDQCFVFTMEDKAEVANGIGKVEIPIVKYDVNCLRVFEDYDSTRFAQNDAQNIEYVKFSIDNNFYNYAFNPGKNSQGQTGIDVDTIVTVPGSNIDFELDLYKKYGLLHTTTESLEKDFNMDTVTIDVNSKNVDLGDLLDIYVNYKYEEDGTITLYFNYFNYINTPYVKIEDNKLKMDTIEGTYLKLPSGHSGILDIVAQFNVYCNGNELRGTRTGVLKSYMVHNISDDKPKFLINRIRTIQKDSLTNPAGQLETYVIVSQKFIDLDNDDLVDNAQIKFMHDIYITSSKTIKPGMKLQLYFNTMQLQYDSSQQIEDQIDIDTSGAADGVLEVTTKAYMTNDIIHIPFKTTLLKNQIVSRGISQYDIDIDDTVTGTTVDNRAIDPITSSGGTTFGYQIVLRKEVDDVNELVLLQNGKRILLRNRQYEN